MDKVRELCLRVKGFYEDTVNICGLQWTLIAFVLYPLVFIIAGLLAITILIK